MANQGPRTIPVTVSLQPHTASKLQELADTAGCSAGRILETLIQREYEARGKQLNAESPWTITDAAIDSAARFLRSSMSRADVRDVLETACVHAALAEKEGRRQPKTLENGLRQYRGPQPQRFTLTVEKFVNGAKPRLIGVSRSQRQ